MASGTTNHFGDEQLSQDLVADRILWDLCRDCQLVSRGASEERPDLVETRGRSGFGGAERGGAGVVGKAADAKGAKTGSRFCVCWDPLDGSSIVGNNWAVGTIVGVWRDDGDDEGGDGDLGDGRRRRDGVTNAIGGPLGNTGRDQVTAIMAVHGPRLTSLVVLDDGVYEFTHDGAGVGTGWLCSRHRITIKETSNIFSPANLRAAEHEGYRRLVEYYIGSERRAGVEEGD